MSVGTLVVRTVLVVQIPLLAKIVGIDPGAAVILLSVLAAIFECLVTALSDAGGASKRGNKGKQGVRPIKSFPLQLGVLYVVQLWFLLLRVGTTEQSTPPPASEPQVAVGGQAASLRRPNEALPPAAPAEVVAPSVAPAQPVKKAVFELDAPPEDLKWSPQTISVVLPCAEERDFALKTVQSVFKETPQHVLHEIVVVDDGSNPPLSQTHLSESVQQQYKVLIKRHENTVGLIGAKKTGGDAATGDIIVFFDCHVAPQPGWHEDFLRLIGENYRRMVVPQITSLDIDTWTQIGGGGGMSKCYVTWDGDFKWGGTDDMYMGMLSGGLAGLSKRWWDESGGFDDQMLGWGGENIDQGIRMWVCGGEIVAAPHAQVAHMWRTGGKTNARYKHVGDTGKNRARAIYAWMGEFTRKLDDYPAFAQRKAAGGSNWYGGMETFQRVKDRLSGCRPFAWYLRRFKAVYEDAGLLPSSIFMIREESSGLCLRYQGQAGTSGFGKEGVVLEPCDSGNDRFMWHLGNRQPRGGKCCSGLRAWNTDQCFQGGQDGGKKAITGICEVSGSNPVQHFKLHADGSLKRGDSCMGPGDTPGSIKEGPCWSFRSRGGAKFTKQRAREPIETTLYHKAQRDHPEIFKKLNEQFQANDPGMKKCKEPGVRCSTLKFQDGSGRCLDNEAHLSDEQDSCVVVYVKNERTIQLASDDRCLDSASDGNAETWTFYSCHGGANQQFVPHGDGKYCTVEAIDGVDQCFELKPF